MGRSVKDHRLDSREARAKQKPRQEPYWRLISKGVHVGYYKGNNKIGMWHARVRTPDGKRYIKEAIGNTDDFTDADGKDILDFAQAQKAAHKFAKKIYQGNDSDDNKPYSVQNAVDDYLTDFQASGKKSLYETKAQIEAHILPTFGDKIITSITFKQLNTWKNNLATTPKRKRSTKKLPNHQQYHENESNDPEYLRRRRATTNRIITILKAILNHAFKNDRAKSNEAWSKLKPFKNASEPKIRFLSEDECKRLMNACEPEFRVLVRGALLTGARYGELTTLRVNSFDQDNQTIYIQESKSGKPRYIPLNQEGINFFDQLTTGRASTEYIFTRTNGSQWKKNYQVRPLEASCLAANIKPTINFHILRHTYGSALAMRGVPLQVIAAVLGHTDTRITHKHYAHLKPSYVADVIKEHLPNFGKTEKSNVTNMHINPKRKAV